MQELIKIKSASYKRYEELLIKKETLLKEAKSYGLLFSKEFDCLFNEVQQARIECVKKRKILSYCKTMVSQGNVIIKTRLDAFVEKAMADYEKTLDSLNKNSYKVEKKPTIGQDDSKSLKAIYRQLAKLIHPDMNSELRENEVVQDLWNRVCIAYSCNDLQELEELEVLVNRYLESINHKHYDVEIPEINEKIFNLNREISAITHSEPYQYKYIMENPLSVAKKKEELTKELNDYNLYSKELDSEIAVFDGLIEDDE